MTELAESEIETLEDIADSNQPWADAVGAYLDALKEVKEIWLNQQINCLREINAKWSV